MSAGGFARRFGRAPELAADAPGRVNLVGEHTDYNDGLVLPTVIPQRTRVTVAARTDDLVRVASDAIPDARTREFTLGHEARGGTWLDYVQGVTWALREAGHPLRGFDAHVTSTVPVGGGLSSSAALEVGVARALRELFGLTLDAWEIAGVAHRAETAFVGAPVGVMDQMACSLADAGAALFIDTRSLEIRRVPIPTAAELLVIDSGVAHDHVSGDYRARRAECAAAAAALGVSSLRDVSSEGELEGLPDTLRRRARHVVTENERVLLAVQALACADLAALGSIFAASHASMRDDYEVSVPEVDRLVEIADAANGVFGTRLTGGGFGGAIVALTEAGRAAAIGARVLERYGTAARGRPRVLVPATT